MILWYKYFLTLIIRLHFCWSKGNQLKDMGHVMVGLTVLQRSTQTSPSLMTKLTMSFIRGGPCWRLDSFWWGIDICATQIWFSMSVFSSTIMVMLWVENKVDSLLFTALILILLSRQLSFTHISKETVNWRSSTCNKWNRYILKQYGC